MEIGDNGQKYRLAISHAAMGTGIDTDIVTIPRLSLEEIHVLVLGLTSSQNVTLMCVQFTAIGETGVNGVSATNPVEPDCRYEDGIVISLSLNMVESIVLEMIQNPSHATRICVKEWKYFVTSN